MKSFGFTVHVLVIAAMFAVVAPQGVRADDVPPAPDAKPQQGERAAPRTALPPALEQKARESIRKGLDYLKSTQAADGGWTAQFGPAVTALAATAFARDEQFAGRDAIVDKAINYALKFRQADGGFYQQELGLHNYQTCIVLMFLGELNEAKHKTLVVDAQKFLKGLQYDENESVDKDNPWYGGAGYTQKKRPDLSNTQMMVEALHASGLPKDDPAYQKALVFISRCQMSRESNDQSFASKGGDGGMIYSPNGGGESKAGHETINGVTVLRSYGSMTYSGFKSMLYAGVDRNDPRVKAAFNWITRHWTMDANPNMPSSHAEEGLFYYYHVMSKALRAYGENEITDGDGRTHNWRVELCEQLVRRQNKDGSWINDKDRWQEGDANYVTALSIMALQEALDAPVK